MATALIIEDGSVVAGANSYVTAQEIVDYAKLRGVTVANDSDQADILAIKAMDYLNIQCFTGEQVEPGVQPLPWPRKCVVPGDTADGYVYSIPPNLKIAQTQLALDVFNGLDLTPSGAATLQLARSKVGPIEREFHANTTMTGSADEARLTVANALLAPLLCGQGGFTLSTVRV